MIMLPQHSQQLCAKRHSTTNQWSRWPQRTAYRHWYNQI